MVAGGIFGNGREWRLSPDGVHLVWDNILFSDGTIGEDEFEGALTLDGTTDPANPRYNLTSVYFLPQPNRGWVAQGSQLVFQPQAMIGEARGWSSGRQATPGHPSVRGQQRRRLDDVPDHRAVQARHRAC